jgi:hypothetical protein
VNVAPMQSPHVATIAAGAVRRNTLRPAPAKRNYSTRVVREGVYGLNAYLRFEAVSMASDDRRRQLVSLLPNVIFASALLLFMLFGLNAWLWWN